MSKKKLFLLGTILVVTILMFQLYSLSNYDHFKAEGGLKVEFTVDPYEVVNEYTRSSLDFDYVMKATVLEHKTNGGDFFNELAKANSDRLQRPLARLMNYKEIKELSATSTDEEVIDFLRNKLDSKLDQTASFIEVRIKDVLNKPVQVDVNSKELILKTELTAYKRKISPKALELPVVKIGFYEIKDWQEFYPSWMTFCQLTQSDSIPEETNKDWKLTDSDESVVSQRGLESCVEWEQGPGGIVLAKDKKYVDQLLQSELFASTFPKELEFRWSPRKQDRSFGEHWRLYIIRIPSNGVPKITEKDIQGAKTGANDYGKHVDLKMNQEGADKWRVMTEKNVGRFIAMCVNDVVLSAPNVISPISDGNTQISGGHISTDIDEIAFCLNTKSPDLLPGLKSQTIVKGNPPVFSAVVQQILIAASVILFLFFSFMFVRNLRAD